MSPSAFILLAFTVSTHAQAPNLTLGNPSEATSDTSNEDNFLMTKNEYILAFNNKKGGANWVAWHLESVI